MKDPKRFDLWQQYSKIPEYVLKDLEDRFCFNRTTARQSEVDGKLDPYFTIFNEGQRSVLLHIREMLREPPDIPEEEGQEAKE